MSAVPCGRHLAGLTIPPLMGGHNWAGRRYDVWFIGPDLYRWHGVRYGDDTEILHCRRTKEYVGRKEAKR